MKSDYEKELTIGELSGEMSAYGHTWPLFTRPILHVELEGFVYGTDASKLQAELEQRLEGLPFDVRVEQHDLASLTLEDQLEYQRLTAEVLHG